MAPRSWAVEAFGTIFEATYFFENKCSVATSEQNPGLIKSWIKFVGGCPDAS